MADTTAATGLTVQQWDDKFFREYIQDSPFKGVMGTSENSIIQVKEDLTKKKGDTIHFALVNKLTNSATTGSNTLEGNEEALDSRSHALTVDQRRHAVRVSVMEEQKSAISLREAGRAQLLDWSMEDQRDLILDALGSINGVNYASASEAQKDAWLTDNADRVLFGAVKSNNSSNDHSASLANIDNTADKLTPAALSLMKRMALEKRADGAPRVRPIRVAGANRRYFTVYTNPRAFRDLKDDTTIKQAQREVSLAKENNRLFDGGDLYWDGMIIKEIDDMDYITGAGAAGIDVGPAYLCGAQAIGFGWAKRWKTTTEEFDYGDKHGVAVGGILGVNKLTFGKGSGDTDDLVDHGVVTGYFAAVADS